MRTPKGGTVKIRGILVLFVLAAFALAPSVFAQEQEQEQANVARLYWTSAKQGQTLAYEAAIKKHNDFHRRKGDPWTWRVWQVVSGSQSGQYLHGTFGHQWKDFDNPPVPTQEDDADYYQNLEALEANWRGEHITFMPKHSYPPDDMDTVRPLYLVWRVFPKPGMTEAYLNAVSKIPEAARKAGVNWRYTFWNVADGGAVPSFYISFPLDNWAQRGVQSMPFEEVLMKAYGRAGAHEIMRAFDDSVARETSMVVVYRPDLSYIPAAAK